MRQLIIGVLMLIIAAPLSAKTVGADAPNIVGRDVKNGGLFSLSRVSDKPKVVNFFWVDCIPCKKEIPLLASKEKKHPNVDFIVVHSESNAATGSNYDTEEIERYVASLDASPKTIVLGSPRLKNTYAIPGFPYSVLLSADNKIEGILIGYNEQTVATLEKWLALQK